MSTKGKDKKSERKPKWAKTFEHGVESFYSIMAPITRQENENYQNFLNKKLKNK